MYTKTKYCSNEVIMREKMSCMDKKKDLSQIESLRLEIVLESPRTRTKSHFSMGPLVRVIRPLSWRHGAIGLVTQHCWQFTNFTHMISADHMN